MLSSASRTSREGARAGLLALLFLVVAAFSAPSGAGAQVCGNFDECTINPVCLPDGTCQGTPVQNGTSCDDDNPCTANDQCLAGACVGNPGPMENQPCESPFGLCAEDSVCHFGLCGSFKQCPDADGNKCTIEICNPETGQCDFTLPVSCILPCSTGTCRSSDGACINPTPRVNGFPCSDSNSCTSPDQCQAGTCVGGGVTPPPTATRTPTGQGTATRTPTGQGTATRTSTGQGTATRTPTRTSTAPGAATSTPTAGSSSCFADCDGDGALTAADLDRIRSTLLRCSGCAGGVPGAPAGGCAGAAGGCPAADFDDDGCLRAGDMSRAIAAAVDPPEGCADSGASVARRAVGTLQSTNSALLLLPRLLSAILGPISNLGGQGGGAIVVFDLPISCPAGGSGSLRCEQDIGGGFPPTFTAPLYTATLDDCTRMTSNGRTIRLDGVVTAEGLEGDICGAVSSPLLISADGLVIQETGSSGSLTATFTNFSALVALSGSDDDCVYSDFSIELAGTLSVVTAAPGGETVSSTQMTFAPGSTVEIIVLQYAEGCTPVVYTVLLGGDVTLVSGGATLAATYSDYLMSNDASGGGELLEVAGGIASACFGGLVNVATDTGLALASGAACPSSGLVRVLHTGGTDAIGYVGGGVTIDLGNDSFVDETFTSCLSSAFYVCPAP